MRAYIEVRMDIPGIMQGRSEATPTMLKSQQKNTKQNIVFQCFHLFTSSRWFYHVLPLPEWAAGKTPTVLAMQRDPGNSAWHIFT